MDALEKLAKEWGQKVDIDADNVPVVFNFRPTGFVLVDRSRLGDWEEAMRTHVGLTPRSREAYPWTGDPRETQSCSGFGDWGNWDDCDCMGPGC